MPRGDRTGPAGMGRMTGRGAGFCAGTGMPGYANRVRGGAGYGRGQGFGRRCRRFASFMPGWMRFGGPGPADQKPDPEFEKQVLNNQAQALQSELDDIKKRLAEIEK
jgi:hypothetical protein